MRDLLAIASLVLSLFGVHLGGTHYSNQLHDDGRTVLRSEAWSDAGQARFECVRSSSGRCRYRLLPPSCDTQDPRACPQRPLREFEVAEGATLALSGLPAFRIEVGP